MKTYIVRRLHSPGVEGVFSTLEAADVFGRILANQPDQEGCQCMSVEEWSVSEMNPEQIKEHVEAIAAQNGQPRH
jgi:hypothetical protein